MSIKQQVEIKRLREQVEELTKAMHEMMARVETLEKRKRRANAK